MTPDTVVVYFSRFGTEMYDHEKITLDAVAKTIAQFKHYKFGGCYNGAGRNYDGVFYVPDDSLMPDEALSLGIRSQNDLFGGVVSRPFVKTKAITHQLVNTSAHRPEGWSSVFAEGVRNVVLPGYTAFSGRDARAAAKRLLPLGPIRLKRTLACGGGGQMVVTAMDEVDAFLDDLCGEELAQYGLVLESNLRRVKTLSVGQITVDKITISYHGAQRLVQNNEGRLTYGGSDLICVRGDWDVLDRLPKSAAVRLGVAQARIYNDAMSAYPGFMASRRNYDVGQGIDGKGNRRSGVFEASWRSGGASTAELAALAAFMQNPEARVVEVSAVKKFGRGCEAPQEAIIHYWGDDPRDGPILRYTVVRTSKVSGSGARPV
jgi:hypothetical protein